MNELKIKRYELKVAGEAAQMHEIAGLVKEVLGNPIFEIVAGIILLELLRRYPKDQPMLGGLWGGLEAKVLEAAITGTVIAQQLAPSVPYLVQGTTEITKLIPALAAMGA